jgi:hypothetical protein
MATDHDDDILTGPVPAPDAEPTAAERAHAKTFAELVDKALAGHAPPAMNADDRALLEVATVIRAASGNAALAVSRRNALVEDALRQAVGGAGTSAGGAVVPIARARMRRWAPWAVAATTSLAAAAAILLWLRAPRRPAFVAPAAASLPETMRSRPADALIGPIARERAGDASARIDTIFADRLDGYRELRLRGSRP